jgi:hypothetical protein
MPEEGGATDAEGVTVAEAEVAVVEPEETADGTDAPEEAVEAGDGGDAEGAPAEAEADAGDSETRDA